MLPVTGFSAILCRTALFRRFSPDELENIRAAGQLRLVEEDCYFFQQGDPATHLYVLVGGCVRLSQVTVDGQKIILRVIAPGQMFGAIGLTEPGAAYPISAEASEDSQALAWETGLFKRLCGNKTGVAFDLMSMMSAYIQEIQDRYRELATERTQQRVARALLRLVAQVGRRMAGRCISNTTGTGPKCGSACGATPANPVRPARLSSTMTPPWKRRRASKTWSPPPASSMSITR
ncbi:MAG: Crp/Fnr family transcriptional regulator [Chloroflexi bacterium]|nr:Crp/Fnr family transcriptional regulator [Chloroflexota bacterium]